MKRVMFWNDNKHVATLMVDASTVAEAVSIAKTSVSEEWSTSPISWTEVQADTFDYGRIDVSKTYKEFSNAVLYAIKYFNDNGFTGALTQHNTDRTEFLISKDGVDDTFTLTSANQNPNRCNIKQYMELFGKSFDMKREIERLKALKASTK